MRLSLQRVRAPLRAPFAAAWGTVHERELVLVRLEDGAGNVGWGEAAPLPGYAGATLQEVWRALHECRDALNGAVDVVDVLGMIEIAQARAALDLAWLDLEGRRASEPVWKVLGADSASTVAVNATISAEQVEAVRAQAAQAKAAGFECVKVKVGMRDDLERVAAVRDAAGPEIAIRLDANGAWTVQQAVSALNELERFGIELCEEPVHGLAEIARVARAVPVSVSFDESAALPGALDRRVCDAACLKVASWGGISGVIAACERARRVGYRVYLASTLDGPLGIGAALHAAAVVRPDLSSGLATLAAFDRFSPVSVLAGQTSAPPGPGLGDGLLEWYRSELL